MLVRVSTVIVPENQFRAQLEHVREVLVPKHESASGLVSLAVLQRILVGYVELQVLSVWRSKDALLSFENHTSGHPDVWLSGCIRIGERTYELVLGNPSVG